MVNQGGGSGCIRKGFGCIGKVCSTILILLIICGLLGAGAVGYQAVALGDKPLMNPAAAKTGLTWNELVADRNAAKQESPTWYDKGCERTTIIVLSMGAPVYVLYAVAGASPEGQASTWGKLIDPKDWQRGYVPVGVSLPEGIFRAYQNIYWHNQVLGASSGGGLGPGCKLRPVKTHQAQNIGG